jgi:hypothetical protein
MSEAAAVARGQRARAELEETAAAFDRVREAILEELAQTSPGQPDKVLKLHLAVQNLAAVRQALFRVAENGELARHAIAAAGLTRPG